MRGMLARGLLLAGLAAECGCLQLERKDVDERKGISESQKRSSMLVVLNGYPGGIDLLEEQGRRVKNQGASLMLTSHEEAEVGMDDTDKDGNPKSSPFKVHAIAPMEFCSIPAVGFHKRPCNRADADNKFMGAALLANSTNHGFRWLLLGDDDTTFNLETIAEALEEYSPKEKLFFGIDKLGRRGSNETMPAGYEKALQNCPRLRPDDGLRLWSVNLTSDITDVNKDCDPMPFRDDSWFQWAKGGNGMILSAGLMDSIAASDWQQCVDRIVTFGGDVRIALCLALLGHRVEHLAEGATGKLSEHKLDLGVPSQHKPKHAKGGKRGDMVQHLKDDKLFSLAKTFRGEAKSVSEDCSSWKGEGINCEIEYPEHNLVRAWMPPDATVMEFGARFGTTSCEIAKQQNNSGNLVVVEPDLNVWEFLQHNLHTHSCNARMLRGAVSSTDLHVAGKLNVKRGYSNRPVEKGGKVVPGFRFHEVQEALGSKVDTLLIDCEGCAQFMMDQIGEPIKSGQIKLIIIEGDMPVGAKDCHKNCMDYKKFFDFLTENGFEMVDKFNDCDRKRTGAAESQWCGTWIDHFAWRLKGSAPDLKLNSNAQTLQWKQDAETSETAEKAQDESEGETEDKTEGATGDAKEDKEESGTEDANDGEKEAESEDKADETEQKEEGEKEAETEDKADETEQTEEDKKETDTEDKADETEEAKEGEEKEAAKPADEKAEEGETDDKPADDEDKEEGEKVIETEDTKKDEKKVNELDTLGAALSKRKADLTKKGHTRQEVNKDPKVVQMASRLRLLKTKPADAESHLSGGKDKLDRKANAKKASAKKAPAKKASAKKAPAKKAAPKKAGKGRH